MPHGNVVPAPNLSSRPPYPYQPGTQADNPPEPDHEWMARTMAQVTESLRAIASTNVDKSNRVDEYRVQGLEAGGESVTTQPLLPDYQCDEIIEFVIITGTPAGTFQLQLGKRVWNLIMPASGILTIGPMALKLSYSDNRQLTATVAGDWSFELCGYAQLGWART